MTNSKVETLLQSLEAAENSKEAMELRASFAALAKKIEAAPTRSPMTAVLSELEKLRLNLDKSPALNALYGLQAKLLLEEAEFKRTGRRAFID